MVSPWSFGGLIARMGYRKNGPIQTAAKEGIFCGRHIQYGNRVSDAKNKTRRKFRVNAHWKNVWIDTLKQKLRIKFSAHALRNVRKFGGVEELIVKRPDLTRDSETAKTLREAILLRKKITERKTVLDLHGRTEKPHHTAQVMERKAQLLKRLR